MREYNEAVEEIARLRADRDLWRNRAKRQEDVDWPAEEKWHRESYTNRPGMPINYHDPVEFLGWRIVGDPGRFYARCKTESGGGAYQELTAQYTPGNRKRAWGELLSMITEVEAAK